MNTNNLIINEMATNGIKYVGNTLMMANDKKARPIYNKQTNSLLLLKSFIERETLLMPLISTSCISQVQIDSLTNHNKQICLTNDSKRRLSLSRLLKMNLRLSMV